MNVSHDVYPTIGRTDLDEIFSKMFVTARNRLQYN